MYHEDEKLDGAVAQWPPLSDQTLRQWAIEQVVMLPTAKAAEIQNVDAVLEAADKICKFVRGE